MTGRQHPDHDHLRDLRIPAAAERALRLGERLARPATLASRILMRATPVAPIQFGTQLISRFTTVAAPEALMALVTQRFASESSGGSQSELPLQARPVRSQGSARWSGPSWPASSPAASPTAATIARSTTPPPEPLLGDLVQSDGGQGDAPAATLPLP
ncbi:MAG TPA: hypothetical protein PKC19_22410, partial [Roseiflexaceae bacterium]|nr:hypothetical protein [Roseiflexaceae bacterium]